jgi:hypothetical protein
MYLAPQSDLGQTHPRISARLLTPPLMDCGSGVRMVLQTTSKNDMTTDKKVARRKLSLLELASDLGNVSKECRVISYSRQQFYEIQRIAAHVDATHSAELAVLPGHRLGKRTVDIQSNDPHAIPLRSPVARTGTCGQHDTY